MKESLGGRVRDGQIKSASDYFPSNNPAAFHTRGDNEIILPPQHFRHCQLHSSVCRPSDAKTRLTRTRLI